MSNLLKYAMRELELAGYNLNGPSDDMNTMMANDVIELIKTFASQGHSGCSAPHCIALFSRLVAFKPLGPLTGNDDGWMDVGNGTLQNKRCSSIFREGGKAYNIDGKVFREPSSACYTNRDSRVDVVFPYTVRDPEYVDVPE